jgi:hypothetical protein
VTRLLLAIPTTSRGAEGAALPPEFFLNNNKNTKITKVMHLAFTTISGKNE